MPSAGPRTQRGHRRHETWSSTETRSGAVSDSEREDLAHRCPTGSRPTNAAPWAPHERHGDAATRRTNTGGRTGTLSSPARSRRLSMIATRRSLGEDLGESVDRLRPGGATEAEHGGGGGARDRRAWAPPRGHHPTRPPPRRRSRPRRGQPTTRPSHEGSRRRFVGVDRRRPLLAEPLHRRRPRRAHGGSHNPTSREGSARSASSDDAGRIAGGDRQDHPRRQDSAPTARPGRSAQAPST